ncbi:MAG: TIGR03621 family F420-dependent LLM class oxidoreductase [Dehalococcoidia bacterium]|nr:TIGR03621 family F420-dependent LLM class oxidoreductase [Dehalococcoidia bacterium]
MSTFQSRSGPEWAEFARALEARGFGALLLPDHLVDMPSPFTALGHAAAATTQLHVGTLVLNNDFRHPVIAAREAATLAVLSGGRFELGLGAGHSADEYREAGISFDPARVRAARLAESVEVIHALRTGQSVRFGGEYYTIEGHALHPRLDGVSMPLLVGGNGQRVLESAGRFADIVSFTGFGPTSDGRGVHLTHFTREGLADRIAIVRAAAGERFEHIELNALLQGITITDDSPRSVAEEYLERMPGLTVDDVLESPFLLIGTIDQMAAKLQRLRDEFGITYFVAFEGALESLTPVIERIRATP